jgi:phenylacetate-CoA ligase
VPDSDLDPVTNAGSFVSWKAARIIDNRAAPDREVLAAREVAHRYAITRRA